MSLGDSKTAAKPWVASLASGVAAVTTLPWKNYDGGVGGSTVASTYNTIDAILATLPADATTGDYQDVLCNWGANDMGDPAVMANEAAWEAYYLAVIDKIHAKAPRAKVYLMRPWRRNYNSEAATLHGWIDTIVAARAFTYVGPDEAVWLKGADDGAAMTVDGVHYSTLGNTTCAAQWQSVLGY